MDPRRGVALFFALLLLVGLLAGLTYSRSTDENSEAAIVRSNIAEYLLRIFGEDSSVYRAFGGKPISQSVEKDHGVAAYVPLYPLLSLVSRVSRYWQMELWHGWTFLLFMLGVVSVYGVTREVFRGGRKAGCAAALLYYLTPRMFAEGHYNNKDMVLLSFVLLVLWLGARLILYGRIRDALLFSLAGAYAANVKIIGAWFWGLTGLLFLFSRIACRRLDKKAWICGGVAVGAFALFYCLITPAIWSDPIGYITYLLKNARQFSRWNLFVLFEGKAVSVYGGEVPPWYYVPKLMAMPTPVFIQLLAGIGLFCWIRNAFSSRNSSEDRNERIFLLAPLLGSAVPLLIGMFSGMVVYNGWRHFFFAYSGTFLFAVYGMLCMGRLLSGRLTLRRLGAAALAVYFCLQAALLAVNHPLQGSYFNPIAAPFVENNYETDYWFLSLGKAVSRLCTSRERNGERELTYTTNSLFSSIVEKSDRALPPSAARYTRDFEKADYYIAFLSYEQLLDALPDDVSRDFTKGFYEANGIDPDRAVTEKWNAGGEFRELFTLTSYGIPIVTVYERN